MACERHTKRYGATWDCMPPVNLWTCTVCGVKGGDSDEEMAQYKRERRCLAHEKVYSSHVLATYPAQHPWICSLCGAEGIDREAESKVLGADVLAMVEEAERNLEMAIEALEERRSHYKPEKFV